MAIIDKPSDYFNTKLYTGTGSATSITGVGFQPDWVWIKKRNGTTSHTLTDNVRGVNKQLFTNEAEAEESYTSVLTAFDSDGFSLSTAGLINASSDTYASWNWKAGGTAVSNTDGSITSSVSANQDAGFSIVSYTGTGANATVGHGLGVAPKMIIIKSRNTISLWGVYHQAIGNTHGLFLNATNAATSLSAYWNNTSPTSSVFSLGGDADINKSSDPLIAYCFSEVKSFSKFGSYVGNGSTNGSYIHLGFKPAFVMAKKSSTTSSWAIFDNKRTPYNVMDLRLLANTSGADDQSSDNNIDFLSNGFKFRSSAGWNASATYIFMAFASNPFTTSTGVPATAR